MRFFYFLFAFAILVACDIFVFHFPGQELNGFYFFKKKCWNLSLNPVELTCRNILVETGGGYFIKREELSLGFNECSYQFSYTHPDYFLEKIKGKLTVVEECNGVIKPVKGFPTLNFANSFVFYALNKDGNAIVALTKDSPQKLLTYFLE